MVSGDGTSRVGTPLVEGARSRPRCSSRPRAPKVIIFKKKRRKNYRRKHGHRQLLTVVRIADIAVA